MSDGSAGDHRPRRGRAPLHRQTFAARGTAWKEVCTREGITINTFMLERSSYLVGFVEDMARDFVRSRRRLIGR